MLGYMVIAVYAGISDSLETGLYVAMMGSRPRGNLPEVPPWLSQDGFLGTAFGDF